MYILYIQTSTKQQPQKKIAKQTRISTQEVCSNQPQSMIYSQELYNFLYFLDLNFQ